MAASEETKEPSSTSPSAISYSVLITSVVYFCVSTSATLSLHLFPDGSSIALPEVLRSLHIHGASSVVAVGGLIGLLASTIGTCFYLPRLIYAMASDSILCPYLSEVSTKKNVSTLTVIIPGLLILLLATFVKLETLIESASIGTLLAYTAVSISVICMRYRPGMEQLGLFIQYEDPDDMLFMQCTDFSYADFHLDGAKYGSNNKRKVDCEYQEKTHRTDRIDLSNEFKYKKTSYSFDDKTKLDSLLRQHGGQQQKESTYRRLDSVINSTPNGSISELLNFDSNDSFEPTQRSWQIVSVCLVLFIIASTILCVLSLFCEISQPLNSWWVLLIICSVLCVLISATVIIARQPQCRVRLNFRAAYVPFVPVASILLNVYLMSSLSNAAWIRFAFWMVLGSVNSVFKCFLTS